MTFDINNGAEATEHPGIFYTDAPTQDTERHIMKKAQLHLDTIERQKAYVAREKSKGGTQGVVFQDAFIRGMRDLGYKDPAWALAELIDNAVQAGANSVEIRLGFDKENSSKAKNPAMIAIVDDGTGMHKDMIGYAVRWGGTDREDDRHGFGRFGYGLPSSCVSIACAYTVYSKVKDDDWYAVSIDLKKLADASSDPKATGELLAARKAKVPSWLLDQLQMPLDRDDEPVLTQPIDLRTLESGTIIVLENLDRLRGMSGWIQVNKLRQRLLHQFGIIYRHWIPEVRIAVDGVDCQAIDPLFLLPHARFVDETPVKAKKVIERAFDVQTRDGKETGTVKIRASYLHPQFSWATPENFASGERKNKRWDQVLAPKHGLNGIMVCREGRQIDVVQPSWTKFQNYDIYVKVEIDFDPVLDEYFSITTSKQQIRIDEDMFEKLRTDGKNAGGLHTIVNDIRREFKRENHELRAEIDKVEIEKSMELPAANAMMEAERFKTRTPRISPEAQREAVQNLEEEIASRTKESGNPEEEVRKQVMEEVKTRPWDIGVEAIEEGPFYIPRRMGEQKRIVLNTAHPFYSRLYAKASGDVRSALQVLLFVLADGEIDADGHRGIFYKAERGFWSGQLAIALSSLTTQGTLDDDASVAMEIEEQVRVTTK
ncbi:MAG: ATP-binding protein [Gammaproteobacteria bacterium]